MNRRPDNLKGRVVRLESLYGRGPQDSRFFMIWGKDEPDLGRKLRDAKDCGDLNRGDRFNGKIWTCPGSPPAPRWTQLDEMSDDELTIIAGGRREEHHLHPSIASQWSDGDLSDLYANSLPVLEF
jgi:hypothetical protein